jgi:glycine/D-amino acid oxidase-like deaminating enzyme
LGDGRKIATPLNWYPCLQSATDQQRANYEIMPMGIHWPDIDEDLGVAGMLRGGEPSDDLVGAALKAHSGQFDAPAVSPGLMVRSRELGVRQIPEPRARRLEHRKSGLPDLRTLCADLG